MTVCEFDYVRLHIIYRSNGDVFVYREGQLVEADSISRIGETIYNIIMEELSHDHVSQNSFFSPEKKLISAAKKGNISKFQKLINKGANVNALGRVIN